MKWLLKLCYTLLICLQLAACGDSEKASKTWVHDEKGLFTASFSSDAKYALVAATGGPARLIDVASNKTKQQWQHTDSNDGIIASALSANNQFALTAERASLALWEIDSGKIIGYWDFPRISDLAISADGSHAIIGMENNQAYYFDLYYGKIVHTFEHDGSINSVALSANGQYAMTGGNEHQAKLWDLTSGELKQQWSHTFKIYQVALSANGAYAMSNASLGKSRIWNTKTGKMISQLPMRYMTVSAASFSPDSKTLLTGRPNQRIDLWSVKTGELLHTWLPKKRSVWRPDTAAIIALAFAADGRSFFSETSSGIAQQWRLSTK
ncbi:hypothetical protein A9Q80_00605 [Cycloclasticus sp. 46_83_sub15_T18]|nr:hypothetical protein A9Q80_00605 [Cycloclasticus sp. 46_83_sub15_T18]